MALPWNQEEFRDYLLTGESPVVELSASLPQVTSARETGQQGGGQRGSIERAAGVGQGAAPTGGGGTGGGDAGGGGAGGGAGGGSTLRDVPTYTRRVVSASENAPAVSIYQGKFPSQSPLYGTKGTTSERLLSPGAEAIKQIPGQIGGVYTEFEKQAGPKGQTFESRGGSAPLQSYISTGEGLDRAAGMVGANYAGPQGLPQDVLAPVSERIGGELTRGEALRSGGGTMALMGEAVPGMTSGMLKYEGRDVFSDPTYRRRAAQQLEEASRLLGTLAEREGAARDYAKVRGNEESEIARRSREWTEKRQGDILAGVAGRATSAVGKQASIEDAWKKFQETGDLQYLYGSGADMFLPSGEAWGNQGFTSPYSDKLAQAKKAFENIISQYPGLSDWQLSPVITNQGNTWYGARNYPGYPGVYETPQAVNTLPKTGGMGTTPQVSSPSILSASARGATPTAPSPTTPTAGRTTTQSAAAPDRFSVFRSPTQTSSMAGTALSPITRAGSLLSASASASRTPTAAATTSVSPTNRTTVGTVRNTGGTTYNPSAPSTGSKIDDIGRNIDEKVTQNWNVPQGSYPDIRNIPGLPDYIQKQLVDLQRNLESTFGERVTPDSPIGREEFKYLYSPYMYESAGVPQWYEPGAITPYVNYQGGNLPTPENMISQEEVDWLNRIGDLLQLQNTYGISPEPYQGPRFVKNEEGYKASEEARMAERKKLLDEAYGTFRNKVSKAHHEANQGNFITNTLGNALPGSVRNILEKVI